MGINCSTCKYDQEPELVFTHSRAHLNDNFADKFMYLTDTFNNPKNLNKLVRLQKLFKRQRATNESSLEENKILDMNELKQIRRSKTEGKSKSSIIREYLQDKNNNLAVSKTIDISIDSSFYIKNFDTVKNGNDLFYTVREEQNDTKAFDQDKLGKTFETFFIRNSYDAEKPYLINEWNYNSNVPQNVISYSTFNSQNMNEFVSNAEIVQREIKKAIIMFTIFNRKNSILTLLNKRRCFELWRDNSTIKLPKEENLKNNEMQKSRHLKKIVNRKIRKTIFNNFFEWFKRTNKLINRNNIANTKIKNFVILKGKSLLHKYFHRWNYQRKELIEKKDKDRLKNYPLSRLMLRYRLKKEQVIIKSILNKWVDRHKSLKNKDMAQITNNLNKFESILTSINKRNLFKFFQDLNSNSKTAETKNIFLKKIYSRRNIQINELLKKRITKWSAATSSRRKSRIMDNLTFLFTTLSNLQNILDKSISRKFINLLRRKASWEKPSPLMKKIKLISFFLKSGEIVKFKRVNKAKNYFWKYAKPLKYYFNKYFAISQRMKQKELEIFSNKWKVEEKLN